MSADTAFADDPITGVLVVSNVLPVVMRKNDSGKKWTVDWDDDSFGRSIFGKYDRVVFIGCPPVYVPFAQRDEVEQLLRPFGCAPVFLERLTAHRHYQGFCQTTLNPVFHSIIDVNSSAGASLPNPSASMQRLECSEDSEDGAVGWLPPEVWTACEQQHSWSAYCEVNRLFAAKVVENFTSTDVIWVQDLPLLLLPSFLARKLPSANVALFLRTPFPPSSLFGTLPGREEILRSMLCCDHLGFQLFKYARNFATCCKRLLGLDFGPRQGGLLGVEYHGRHVLVTCRHVGLDLQRVSALLLGSTLGPLAEGVGMGSADGGSFLGPLTRRFRWDLLAVGCDPLDSLSGLPLKLLALAQHLAESRAGGSGWREEHVRLLQVCARPDHGRADYARTREEVVRLVDLINRTWSPRLVAESVARAKRDRRAVARAKRREKQRQEEKQQQHEKALAYAAMLRRRQQTQQQMLQQRQRPAPFTPYVPKRRCSLPTVEAIPEGDEGQGEKKEEAAKGGAGTAAEQGAEDDGAADSGDDDMGMGPFRFEAARQKRRQRRMQLLLRSLGLDKWRVTQHGGRAAAADTPAADTAAAADTSAAANTDVGDCRTQAAAAAAQVSAVGDPHCNSADDAVSSVEKKGGGERAKAKGTGVGESEKSECGAKQAGAARRGKKARLKHRRKEKKVAGHDAVEGAAGAGADSGGGAPGVSSTSTSFPTSSPTLPGETEGDAASSGPGFASDGEVAAGRGEGSNAIDALPKSTDGWATDGNGTPRKTKAGGGDSSSGASDGLMLDGPVVWFREVDAFSLEQRLALFSSGDLLLMTRLMDGFCRTPLEYVAAQEGRLLRERYFQREEDGGAGPKQSKSQGQAHSNERAGALWDHVRSVYGPNADADADPDAIGADACCAGASVLSEFAGASRVLTGALSVNPYQIEEVGDAIGQALNMSGRERRARHEQQRRLVGLHLRLPPKHPSASQPPVQPSEASAGGGVEEAFNVAPAEAADEQQQQQQLQASGGGAMVGRPKKERGQVAWASGMLHDARRGRKPAGRFTTMGLGLRVWQKWSQRMEVLNTREVVQAYRTARRRLLVLNLDSFIGPATDGRVSSSSSSSSRKGRSFSGDDEGWGAGVGRARRQREEMWGRGPQTICEEVLRHVQELCADARNVVFVMSQADKQLVVKLFGHIRALGLVAESGFCVRWPQGSAGGGSGGRSGWLRVSSRSWTRYGDDHAIAAEGTGGRGDGDSPGVRAAAAVVAASRAAGVGGQSPSLGPQRRALDDDDDELSADDEQAELEPAPHKSEQRGGGEANEWCAWHEVARETMEVYRERSNGAQIFGQGVSGVRCRSLLCFDFAACDPELAGLQANELQQHLGEVLAGMGAEVTRTESSVCVRPAGANKGAAMRRIWSRYCGSSSSIATGGLSATHAPSRPTAATAPGGQFGLVLAMGDSECDHSCFSLLDALDRLQQEEQQQQQHGGVGAAMSRHASASPLPHSGVARARASPMTLPAATAAFSAGPLPGATAAAARAATAAVAAAQRMYKVCVGRELTSASHFLTAPDDACQLLRALTVASVSISKSVSSTGLSFRRSGSSSSSSSDLREQGLGLGLLAGAGVETAPESDESAANLSPMLSAHHPSDPGPLRAQMLSGGGAGDTASESALFLMPHPRTPSCRSNTSPEQWQRQQQQQQAQQRQEQQPTKSNEKPGQPKQAGDQGKRGGGGSEWWAHAAGVAVAVVGAAWLGYEVVQRVRRRKQQLVGRA